MTNQCQHGQLARVCLTCEHEATIAALTAERDRLREENFALAAGQCVNATADDGGRLYCEEVVRLREELERARVALVIARATLERANTTPNGPIWDTIWHGDCETLFDYMDAAIDAMKGKP